MEERAAQHQPAVAVEGVVVSLDQFPCAEAAYGNVERQTVGRIEHDRCRSIKVQQHAHLIAARIGHNQVGHAVAVEVGHGDVVRAVASRV